MNNRVSNREKIILKLVKNESLDPQIYYNLDKLKKKGLLKVSRYMYKITIKGRLVLIFDMLKKREFIIKKQKQFDINQDFFKNYLPKNEDMIE